MIDLSLRQLRYMAAVADGASFADAADDLLVTQSALSQGLARLEALLETPLFEPDGRRRRLTSAGRLVAGYARRTLAATDGLTEGLADRQAGRSGTLTVAMIDAALYLFPDAIDRFRTQHPDARLMLNVSDSQRCLEVLGLFEADLAIVVGPVDRFDSRLLTTEALHVYGPGRRLEPNDLWLLYPNGSQTRRIIDLALAELGSRVNVAAESSNPAVLAEMASLMDGWVALPSPIVAQMGRPLTRHKQLATRDIVVARRSMSPSNPLVDDFVASLAG